MQLRRGEVSNSFNNMLRQRLLLRPPRLCTRGVSTLLPSVDIVGGERSEVRNVWCIGRNYVAHARELNNVVPTEEPVLFLKASSACRPLSAGPVAFESETFHHEIEMVLLVGEHVPLGGLTADRDPTACLRAVGLGLDLTRRGKQNELKKAGLPWTLAESFAGAALSRPLRHPTAASTWPTGRRRRGLRAEGQRPRQADRPHVEQARTSSPHVLTSAAPPRYAPHGPTAVGTPRRLCSCPRRGGQNDCVISLQP